MALTLSDFNQNVRLNRKLYSLRDILKGLKGRFILSLNDKPEVRDCFAGFNIESVAISYTLSKGKGTPANEVIISN